MTNYEIIPCTQGTKEWLSIRKTGIGGSDAAAALGVSRYKSQYELYLDKINPAIESEEFNFDMERGKALEPVIRKWYSLNKGKELVAMNAILRSSEYPFMLASLDAEPDNKIFEFKTSRSKEGWGEPGSDQIPQEYLIQVQHSLIVTGLPVADVAVSFFAGAPELYTIEANKELQEIIIEGERTFWEKVQNKIEPDLATDDDIKIKYAQSKPGKTYSFSGGAATIKELKAFKSEADNAYERAEHLKKEVQNLMQDAEVLIDENDPSIILATWKTGKAAETFNTKLFKAEHPEIYNQYLVQGSSQRRFLIK